jgi:hypothetical protein
MSEALATNLAARKQARLDSGIIGFNPDTEFQMGFEAGAASTPVPIPLTVVADYDELWAQVTLADEAGRFVSIRDAGHRFWIIGGDEHGDHWATSFPEEDDILTLPCDVALAPIRFPAALFSAPAPDGDAQ